MAPLRQIVPTFCAIAEYLSRHIAKQLANQKHLLRAARYSKHTDTHRRQRATSALTTASHPRYGLHTQLATPQGPQAAGVKQGAQAPGTKDMPAARRTHAANLEGWPQRFGLI
ncbi:hypothetical protein, partial [Vogesella sp.]|uniref:hypothetical protein n=1 Tax=Vogesella sp. TaxID=1904252 RepID=UPI003F676614